MSDQDHLAHVEHDHEGLVHTHRHHHVTHNWNATSGTFEHLSSEHAHEHDHAPLRHAHVAHQDFEAEHEGEAHIHDHAEPVQDGNGSAPAKRAAAKKDGAAKAPARATKKAAKAT